MSRNRHDTDESVDHDRSIGKSLSDSTDDDGRGFGPDRDGVDRDAGNARDRDYERRYRRRPDEVDFEDDYQRPALRSLREDGHDYLRRAFGMDRLDIGRRRGTSRSRLRCRDIMTRDVAVVTRDMTLQDVAIMMREEDTGIIPVVEFADAYDPSENARIEQTARRLARMYSNGKLVGLITDRDIVVRAVAEGKDATTTRAEEVMTTEIHAAHQNDRVIDVIRKMGDKQVRRIPVVSENGNLRGIISMADVVLETEADHELADALEEISSGASFWNRVFG